MDIVVIAERLWLRKILISVSLLRYLLCFTTGDAAIEAEINDLKSACKRTTCAWRGKRADFPAHTCPYQVREILDVQVLQDILNRDERIHIKVCVLNEVGKRIWNERSRVVNDEYLGMVTEAMHRNQLIFEIQNECLDVLLKLAEIDECMLRILERYDAVVWDVQLLRNRMPMREKAQRLLNMLGFARLEQDVVKGIFVSRTK